ncbi:MAG: class I tRNA ligase family protein, partial [Desulfamplus sp.]|nr:class I tRNA ligase family protein [Desulfamplus sp.]
YNTIERKNVLFKPMEQGKVSVYTCGPTVDRPLHVGNYRRFVSADILCRYLEYRKLSVNHVVNITDLDDKTIQGSEKAGISLEDFTDFHFHRFKNELEQLSIREAQAYPRVSDHVDGMVRLASSLTDKGAAYEKLNSLYFDISTLPSYGSLSGVDLNKIRVGATVDLDDYEKDNPRDFTLLKRVGLSELKRGLCINTRWGNVRPSLHLQCAAISTIFLGEQFDIHTGSRELLFPHHENEVAISLAATGKPPARYWMHCDSVHYDDAASDCEGIHNNNGQSEKDCLEKLTLPRLSEMGWEPRVIRFWLLSTHYRKPLVLSRKALDDAKLSLAKLDRCIHSLVRKAGSPEGLPDNGVPGNGVPGNGVPGNGVPGNGVPGNGVPGNGAPGNFAPGNGAPGNGAPANGARSQEMEQMIYDLRHGFSTAMDDDFKISGVLAVLFQGVKNLNRLMDEGQLDPPSASLFLDLFREMDSVLKIFDFTPRHELSKKAEDIMERREAARQSKNWEEADSLREELLSMGIEIHDGKL